MPTMTREELYEFLWRPLRLSFTTIRPDGSPQVTPIWYEYDDGKFYCWVDEGTVKVRNIQWDPRVALCTATHDDPYKYVIADGTCEIVRDGVAERASSISQRYYGGERGRRFARETLESGNSVLLVVTPTKLLTESAA